MRKVLVIFVFLLAVAAAGCKKVYQPAEPPRSASAPQTDAPAFTVTLWDSTTLEGPLEWRRDGSVSVGGREVASSDIRSVNSMVVADEDVGDVASLPAGFKPLSDEMLAEYRLRADEAAERNKGVASVFCLDKGVDTAREDGSSIYRYHALFLVLKEAGRDNADITLGFREGRSRCRVFFARVITPEGKSRWAPREAFTVSVPPQSAEHLDKRRRVLSGRIPGVEVGAFVEYAYEYERYNPEMKNYFFPSWIFQSDVPVLDSVIDILVPAGKPLSYVAWNIEGPESEPIRFTRDGYDGYRWELNDVEPLTGEPYMPPRTDISPSVHASLYTDWPTLMEPTGNFQSERVRVTPEVAKLAGELTEGKETDDEKVAAIYHWVQRNINYLSIKASLSSGWAGHPAGETLANGYGDCTDVANLVSSLCRAVGIDAYPAIVKTSDAGKAVTEIPVPDANHAIALVYPNGKPRFIDPTSTDYRYPYFRADNHGVKAVIYIKREIVEVPVPPPEDNLRISIQDIDLAIDGSAKVVEKNIYNGPYEAGVRGYWRSVPPQFRGRVMQQYLQGRVPGAVLEDFDLGDIDDLAEQLQMTINYTIPSIGTKVNDLFILALPSFDARLGEVSLPEREHDVDLMTTAAFETTVRITIPEGLEVAGLPDDLSIKGKYIDFAGTLEETANPSSVTAKMVFRKLSKRVPVSDYAQYRKDATAVAAWTKMRIVLRETDNDPQEEAAR